MPANPWIGHVKSVAKEKGISYREALKVASQSYTKKSGAGVSTDPCKAIGANPRTWAPPRTPSEKVRREIAIRRYDAKCKADKKPAVPNGKGVSSLLFPQSIFDEWNQVYKQQSREALFRFMKRSDVKAAFAVVAPFLPAPVKIALGIVIAAPKLTTQVMDALDVILKYNPTSLIMGSGFSDEMLCQLGMDDDVCANVDGPVRGKPSCCKCDKDYPRRKVDNKVYCRYKPKYWDRIRHSWAEEPGI